jgi:hypothetical protein
VSLEQLVTVAPWANGGDICPRVSPWCWLYVTPPSRQSWERAIQTGYGAGDVYKFFFFSFRLISMEKVFSTRENREKIRHLKHTTIRSI